MMKAACKKALFGPLEPDKEEDVDKTEIDLIHVPGVVFNFSRLWIGYGGGYYDRYLVDFAGASISSIYSFQQSDLDPIITDIK